jgi:hypothetical protein
LRRITGAYSKLTAFLEQSVSIAPLVSFRIAFGLIMLFSTLRYMAMGWVDTQLVEPIFHFSYFGFDWVKPLPRLGMYTVFFLLAFSSIAITLGWFYRLFTVLFFLCFTYVELIDITYYLNHYYFVSIVSFLLIFAPANRYFSLDARRNPEIRQKQTGRWSILMLKLQIAIVYIFAGVAKINGDWLLEALPLSIWLPAKTSIPIIGFIFEYEFTPYLFSWAGMLFDTLIIFGLLYKPTRWLAYVAVFIFHTLTGILFQIGVFPIVMIFAVTIFFSERFHERLLGGLGRFLGAKKSSVSKNPVPQPSPTKRKILFPFLILFITFQFLFPWRYLLYPGNLFWTEEGYRFSWRVMLMEKAGTATFFVKDGEDGREGSVVNYQFLNDHQEKQMAMQPDLILQYAHLLEAHYENQGMKDPQVRAEVFVTLNARPATLLIDPEVDLTEIEDTWVPKTWIMPLKENKIQ